MLAFQWGAVTHIAEQQWQMRVGSPVCYLDERAEQLQEERRNWARDLVIQKQRTNIPLLQDVLLRDNIIDAETTNMLWQVNNRFLQRRKNFVAYKLVHH